MRRTGRWPAGKSLIEFQFGVPLVELGILPGALGGIRQDEPCRSRSAWRLFRRAAAVELGVGVVPSEVMQAVAQLHDDLVLLLDVARRDSFEGPSSITWSFDTGGSPDG